MAYGIGVALFALGILLSLVLHEIGHAATARAFGMKVTRFFVGFGPTLFSVTRRGVEYGVKAIPVGAFVKIVGMTRLDDVAPEDDQTVLQQLAQQPHAIGMQPILQLSVCQPGRLTTGQPVQQRVEPRVRAAKSTTRRLGCVLLHRAPSLSMFALRNRRT